MTNTDSPRPLFKQYPGLRTALPHIPMGALPTPVERLDALEQSLDAWGAALYIKRDDLSGQPYGGNKVRKLEFVLAHAAQQGYKSVLTFGGAGSNHALATALYARTLGLHCISMLIPQPNAYSVRANLLLSLQADAELHQAPGMVLTALATVKQLLLHGLRAGQFPYLIAPGGTSPRGMIGFVNAAFELREQIEAGQLPEPDYIYAASGTMGTVIGLLLGLQAAGLCSQVVAVRVTAPQFTSMRKARRLFRAANAVLRNADPAFPTLPFPEDTFILNHDFYGEEYGLYTNEAMNAVHLFENSSGVHLEGTYTGKTAAALLADIESGKLRGKAALFWNTHNSHDFSNEIADLDYHQLPKEFHRYFEEDVQPLEQSRPMESGAANESTHSRRSPTSLAHIFHRLSAASTHLTSSQALCLPVDFDVC